jgi:hypothetical protein
MLRDLAVWRRLKLQRGKGPRGRHAPRSGPRHKLLRHRQAYGFGTSEQIVGKALEPEIKSHREEVVLATKGGLRMEGDQMLRDSSPEWFRQGVEDSLRYLGTD